MALAVQLLGRAAAENPHDAEGLALLGMAYSQIGQHPPACRTLQAAIQRQPVNAGYRYQLGLALERAGDRYAAAQAYRDALRVNPAFSPAQGRLSALGGSQPPAGPAAAPAPPLAQAPTAPSAAAWSAPAGPPAGLQGGYPEAPRWDAQGRYYPDPDEPRSPVVPDMEVSDAFLRRLGASLLDSIIMSAILWGVILLGGLTLGAGAAVVGGSEAATALGALSVLVLGYVVAPVLAIGYLVWMHHTRGQTLGQRALGIRVVAADGGNPTLGQALLRDTVGRWISSAILLLGYFWMLWDPSQQTWGDKISSTYVRRA
jgi:uncharacterized RDD family membrane protein YckC